jgi:hypothetical protein
MRRMQALGLATGLAAALLVGLQWSGGPRLRSSRAESAEVRPPHNPLNNAYFGDLHVHTKISIDSFLRKNMLNQEDAYRFAHGEEVQVAGGERVRLTRPLDFVAITDHSESFPLFDMCTEGAGPASRTDYCKTLKGGDPSLSVLFNSDEKGGAQPEGAGACLGTPADCDAAAKRVWDHIRQLADRENRPGKFTAFIGYEYSGSLPGPGIAKGHLHRNVIFRNSDVPDHAESAVQARRNIELWKWLDKSCAGKCEVMAIPHNANLSWGMSFALETQDHTPYSVDDWRRRAKYERLTEIYQIKGISECGVGFGTNDEECGFNAMPYPPCTAEKRTQCYGDGSFVRNALKNGLLLRDRLGFNPFKLGFIASTDTHNATPGQVDEKTYVGSIGVGDGSPQRRLAAQLYRNPGGLAGVWAPENTRDALFDAMKRRETFGTSGPRIKVRLFGGWSLPPDLASRADFVGQGYKLGVPMGQDLPAKGRAGAPSFLVWAAADPQSAKLRRIQIIKGWSDGKATHEAIYDVSCSDGLVPDPRSHRCPSNGATVDLKDCSITAGKGAAELRTMWLDPEFDPKRPAFYYARVFENPSCRWSAWDALRIGRPVPPIPSPAQEERAWSSPIWYEP